MNKENTHLNNINEKWKWTDNNIGNEGARMISEVLKRNSTLTKLDLGGDKNEEWIDKENRDKMIEMEVKNEQSTILEQKEQNG